MSDSEKAKIILNGKDYECPVIVGTEGERGIDVSKLRSDTGYVTLDEGFGNTAACESSITYINGEKGYLRYRGIPIEDLAENSTFIETAYLIIYGELPTRKQMSNFSQKVLRNANLHEGMMQFFDGGFPFSAHPMAILSALLNSVGCYYPHMVTNQREQDLEHFDDAAALCPRLRLIRQGRPRAAPADGGVGADGGHAVARGLEDLLDAGVRVALGLGLDDGGDDVAGNAAAHEHGAASLVSCHGVHAVRHALDA